MDYNEDIVHGLAAKMRRGVALLDKKIPNWRAIVRRHRHQFDFSKGDCCVLGTLEHYSGRMRVLEKKHGVKRREGRMAFETFTAAARALGLNGGRTIDAHGFDADDYKDDFSDGKLKRQRDLDILSALWRAEAGF